MNFDFNNLNNNGIIVETTSYTKAIWNDTNLKPIEI